jgi:hypothetical protein
MRAMADVQADALRAAGDLLERVLGADGEPPGGETPPAERGYTALLDAWADVLQRVAAGLTRPETSRTVAIPVDADVVGSPIRLVLGSADEADLKPTEIWLHNGTPSAVGPLALVCGPLTSPDGVTLENVELRFDPATVEELPARSSRAVLVSLARPGPLRPGVYRGTIQAHGAPTIWLPLEVAVA